MKMNLPENSPSTSAMSVGANDQTLVSNSPGSHPTCAPGSLLLPTRHDLNAHWLKTIPPFSAVRAWHDFIKWLELNQPTPALN